MSRNAQCFTNSSNPCAEMVTLADTWQSGADEAVSVGPYEDLGGILPAGKNSTCKGAPIGGWYVCAYGPLELTACHGYCTDYLECTTTDIMLEADYVYTIFDWQNFVFLMFILLITKVGRFVFRKLYQAHMAHEAVKLSKKNMVAPDGAATTGFDSAIPEPQAAGEGANTAPPVGQTKSRKDAWDEHHVGSWWSEAVDEPAVLICLAAFLFSISNICFASITEFGEGNLLLKAVGFDSAYAEADADSIKARLKNIGSGLLWTVVGTSFMVLTQLSIRKILFRKLQTDLATMVTEGATADDSATRGSNVAAGIVEAGGVVAAGLIGSASVAGPPSDNVLIDLAASVLYFVLGQLVYLAFMEIFDVFFINGTMEQALEKDLPESQWLRLPKGQICKKGNAAVAISHASMSVSFALLVSRATYSSYELANFGVFSIVGGGLQLALRVVVDFLIMPHAKVDDEIEEHGNWGFALVVGSLQIYLARVISSLVDDSCQDFVYNADFYCADAGEACDTGFLAHRPSERAGVTIDISRVCWDDETVCTNEATWPKGYEHGTVSDCKQAAVMSLGEKLSQIEMALNFFQLNHLLQLVIALGFLWVAKFLYALPYFLCQGKEDGEAERVRRLGGGEAALSRTQSGLVVKSFSLESSIMDHKSHAVAISFAGYVCGLGSIMQGLFKDVRLGYFSALSDPDCKSGEWCDSNNANGMRQIVEDLMWALIGLGMLMVTQLLSEKVVLYWASNSRALMSSDNRALALIEAGMYAGSGFIIAAVLQAENGVLSAIFFAAGELFLVLYCFLYQKFTKFDDREAIAAKNVAAGLHWGLNIAALGLLLSRAIYLSNSIIVFVVWFAVGAPLLLAVNFVVDKIIFPRVSIEDEIHLNMDERSQSDNDNGGGARNWGIALVAGTVAISMAQLLSTFLRDCAFEFGVH